MPLLESHKDDLNDPLPDYVTEGNSAQTNDLYNVVFLSIYPTRTAINNPFPLTHGLYSVVPGLGTVATSFTTLYLVLALWQRL